MLTQIERNENAKVSLYFVALACSFFSPAIHLRAIVRMQILLFTKLLTEPIAPGSFNAASGISFDSASIQKFLADKPLFKEFSKDFDTFYRSNNYNYVWYDKNGLIETSSAAYFKY